MGERDRNQGSEGQGREGDHIREREMGEGVGQVRASKRDGGEQKMNKDRERGRLRVMIEEGRFKGF